MSPTCGTVAAFNHEVARVKREAFMKPVQLIAILGAVLIAAVIGWYFYMEMNPPYLDETTDVRGLQTPAGGATPASNKAKASP